MSTPSDVTSQEQIIKAAVRAQALAIIRAEKEAQSLQQQKHIANDGVVSEQAESSCQSAASPSATTKKRKEPPLTGETGKDSESPPKKKSARNVKSAPPAGVDWNCNKCGEVVKRNKQRCPKCFSWKGRRRSYETLNSKPNQWRAYNCRVDGCTKISQGGRTNHMCRRHFSAWEKEEKAWKKSIEDEEKACEKCLEDGQKKNGFRSQLHGDSIELTNDEPSPAEIALDVANIDEVVLNGGWGAGLNGSTKEKEVDSESQQPQGESVDTACQYKEEPRKNDEDEKKESDSDSQQLHGDNVDTMTPTKCPPVSLEKFAEDKDVTAVYEPPAAASKEADTARVTGASSGEEKEDEDPVHDADDDVSATIDDAEPPSKRSGPSYINKRVAKEFHGVVYHGTVTAFASDEDEDNSNGLWRITYDDGDEEDFDRDELEAGLQLLDESKVSK